ncbi:C2 domain-containing protein 5 isoform X6 [Phyllobates terribilis]|uniref:C2 domain-containing protein 5 isoform X6 n=1 Tax=Phyllobates terribilis TaxID=111132 RepID=UPI003CCA7092
MPGKLKVKIVAGRHLPVMDRASDLTDAFVEVKFANTTFKTDVYPKSLNPQWNSEWFKFEVDDEDLQDEPLQITVLDHDTYSANDAIGKVYIDIDPLLYTEAATVISGWFPIYDTIHGIRGEISVVVKVDLFNDLNRFRQSSCGVKFFCTTSIPKSYRAVVIHGFVEELVVNEDPEYQWIDRIRTPRASNEARQRLISLMSGELQRKIGLKVLEMRGNAVVGYLQCFDLEGESGLVVRAIGTACTLDKLTNPTPFLPACHSPCKELKEPEDAPLSPPCAFCHIPYDELNMPFPAHLTLCCSCRRQKVPDVLFTTIDLPAETPIVGKGCLIQARLCRLKKKAQAEANATAISNLLPFLEYELHTQLMNKLKLKSMNALFGLRIQITVGENMLLGLASATGVYLASLPTPGGIQISGKTPSSDGPYEQHICHMQKKINETIAKNKELYEITPPEIPEEALGSPIPESRQRTRLLRSQSESSDELVELDLSHGKKDAFVLEIDDTDAVEDVHSLLTDVPPPPGFYSCNTEIMPGINNWTSDIQMFTSVRVIRLSSVNLTNQTLNKSFSDMCENLLKSLYFKLRSMVPCCLCHVNFTVAVPEDESIQVTVTAVAITYNKQEALQSSKSAAERPRVSTDADEMLQFPLELSLESPGLTTFSPAKDLQDRTGPAAGAPHRASAADFSSFADRCSSWIEHIRMRAHTIRRGSVKTMTSMDKASPLGEGHLRNRPVGALGFPTVTVVKMTPLSFIPGAKITKYLGIINMFFIRETTSLREEGGVSGFLHAFICEVFAMVRAHVAALGGNAVVSYIMKQCVFMENTNKNQAQCLINVSGDAVIFTRESETDVTSSILQQHTNQAAGEAT